MGMMKKEKIDYSDGRTKQAFKESCDINKILSRAQKTGTVSHLAKHQAFYGDFGDFDFLEAQTRLTRGREIFDDLPSEIRKEFNQSPAEFFEFVNKPENADQLHTVLPGLAAPGRQNLDVSGKTPPQLSGVAAHKPKTEGSAAPSENEPSTGSTGAPDAPPAS